MYIYSLLLPFGFWTFTYENNRHLILESANSSTELEVTSETPSRPPGPYCMNTTLDPGTCHNVMGTFKRGIQPRWAYFPRI